MYMPRLIGEAPSALQPKIATLDPLEPGFGLGLVSPVGSRASLISWLHNSRIRTSGCFWTTLVALRDEVSAAAIVRPVRKCHDTNSLFQERV